jgi:hypothetical protein
MTTVFCTFRVEGVHHWPDAPLKHTYLSCVHRHTFHVRVEVVVGHNNRDVEFIALQHDAGESFMSNACCTPDGHTRYCGMLYFGAKSCEALAAHTLEKLVNDFSYNVTAVEVSEDGENGARITRS